MNSISIVVCDRCGYRASADYVAMVDTCPGCNATPFTVRESGVFDYSTRTYTGPVDEDSPDVFPVYVNRDDAGVILRALTALWTVPGMSGDVCHMAQVAYSAVKNSAIAAGVEL